MKCAIIKRISLFVVVIASLFILLTIISNIGLHTTIIQLEKDNTYITLIGTLHIGEKWEDVQKYLNNQDIVIYEAVPEGAGLESVMDPYRKLAEYTGSVFQGDGLEYQDEWIMSDVTMDELLTFYPKEKIKRDADSIETFKGCPPVITRWILGLTVFYLSNFKKNDPLVNRRNDNPIQEALRQAETYRYRYISIIYGNLHLPKMISMLKENGFTRVVLRVKVFQFK